MGSNSRKSEKVENSEEFNTRKNSDEFNSIDLDGNQHNVKEITGHLRSKDDSFKEFRRLLENIRKENNYVDKCGLLSDMFTFGSNGVKFQGNIIMWSRLLLPDLNPMINKMKTEQLVKLFSKIFDVNIPKMSNQYKKTTVIDDVIVYFYINEMAPSRSTTLTIEQVDDFLSVLSKLTEENDQVKHFKIFLPLCTAGDLDCIVKLISHDLKIDLKSKDILEAIHTNAYSAFLICNDVTLAMKQCFFKYDNLNVVSEPIENMTDQDENESCDELNKDNSFKEFRRLVANIRNENNFTNKIDLLTDMFTFGSDGVKFKGNIITWCKLLLPNLNSMIFKMKIEHLLKLFSTIFDEDLLELCQHLDQTTSINATIVHFYGKKMATSTSRNLTMDQVDEFFKVLSKLTSDEERVKHLKQILPYCTIGDLDCIVLLMRHNLNMGLEPKHILEAAHPDAYSAYLSCNDITLSLYTSVSKLLPGVDVTNIIKEIHSESNNTHDSINLNIHNNLSENDYLPFKNNSSKLIYKQEFTSRDGYEINPIQIEKEGMKATKKSRVTLNNDNTFDEFRKLFETIRGESDYIHKSAFLAGWFHLTSDNIESIIMWCKLLLPEQNPMIKYMSSMKLINLFSRIFAEDESAIYNYLEQSSSIDECIAHFYIKKMAPPMTTTLTINQVNDFFLALSKLKEENEQINLFKNFLPFCTARDLRFIIKLVNHNLNIGLAPKHILEAIHPDVYTTFLSCNNIALSINTCFKKSLPECVSKPIKSLKSNNLDRSENCIKSDQFRFNINVKKHEKPFANKHKKECEAIETNKPDAIKTSKIILRNNNTFEEFREVLDNIRKTQYFTNKIALLTELFKFGSCNIQIVIMWCRLLLPEHNPMIKYMNIDLLVKLFSRIFTVDSSEIFNHTEKSHDIAESIAYFYAKKMDPPTSTTLKIGDVNEFISFLSQHTKEDEQVNHITNFLRFCTIGDITCIVKLLRHNLNINLAPKYILKAIHPDAYNCFVSLGYVSLAIKHCLSKPTEISTQNIVVMDPFKFMIPVPCKSIKQALCTFPKGFHSEIKYNGVRIQVHKKNNKFKYFSKKLKPIEHNNILLNDCISNAIPNGKDIILDCELLKDDMTSGEMLGFNNQDGIENDSFCLIVSDCLYFNGINLCNRSLKFRREVLLKNIIEIPKVIMCSNIKEIYNPIDLAQHIKKIFSMRLDGLILKDINGIYGPGESKWLQVTKRQLYDGSMASSANLIVLGGWCDDNQINCLSSFLMGVYDAKTEKYYTVIKLVHHVETMDMSNLININCDVNKKPNWLNCTNKMVPQFIAKDPKQQAVWQIIGEEFIRIYRVHTANGISMKHAKVLKTNTDKNWETATSLEELIILCNVTQYDFDGTLIDNELKSIQSGKK